jgi:phospholipid/cholesterol/gamma-HCH transport system substrate-binding protein
LRRLPWTRFVAAGALCAAVLAVVLALRGGDDQRTLHVHFADAGQLIAGDLVEVGGIPVGTVTGLDLTANGLADVQIRVHDKRFIPLRAGTTATIATVGLTGVTNRFVALHPGPASGRALPDGATLPETATQPIIDIDLVLDAITPPVRRDFRAAAQASVGLLRGSVPAARNAIHYGGPLLSRLDEFARQLTDDRPAFTGLVRSGAQVASTLASREHDLTAGIDHTARTFAAVEGARRSLTGALDQAPATLAQASSTLRALRPTLAALTPALRDAQPVAAPLARALRVAAPTARAAGPAVGGLDAALPDVRRALGVLPALATTAVPALDATSRTLTRLRPIVTGLRPYGQDILQAIVRGFGGQSSFNYDANGQFGRIALGLPPSSALTSIIGTDIPALSPNALKGQTAKCPGTADRPAPDRSNVPPEPAVDCDPAQVPG